MSKVIKVSGISSNFAKAFNAQFSNTASNYLDVEKRFNQSLASNLNRNTRLFNLSVMSWQARHPTVKTFSDIEMVEVKYVAIQDLVIDTTMQRLVDWDHVCSILQNFDPLMVMPICVYSDPQHKKLVVWDGQHTLLVLYTIACKILGASTAQAMVPIAIYKSNQKSQMRRNFIELNGEAKSPLELIDTYQQMVFGVRVDGATNTKWAIAESKQTVLETHGMFATHAKFGNETQPGALSNLTEFDKYPVAMVELICKYFVAVCDSSRPVDAKEFWLIGEYLHLAAQAGITLDDNYIQHIADALNAGFDGNFDPDALCKRANQSFLATFAGTSNTLTRKERGVQFLIHQIKKGLGTANVPVPTPLSWWTPPPSHLF